MSPSSTTTLPFQNFFITKVMRKYVKMAVEILIMIGRSGGKEIYFLVENNVRQ